MVGYLEPTVVDIHESDDDDVPEIDHSGPIHSMRRPIPPKYGGLPNYKDLLGNEDEGAGDTGGATGRLLPQITKKSPRMSDDTGGATRRLLPQITKKSPRRSDDIGGATGRLLPPIMKNSPRRYKRYR